VQLSAHLLDRASAATAAAPAAAAAGCVCLADPPQMREHQQVCCRPNALSCCCCCCCLWGQVWLFCCHGRLVRSPYAFQHGITMCWGYLRLSGWRTATTTTTRVMCGGLLLLHLLLTMQGRSHAAEVASITL
jgi:hypothetical protein